MCFNEIEALVDGAHLCSWQPAQHRQRLLAPTEISNRKFADNHWMYYDEPLLKCAREIRYRAAKVPHPDGRVGDDHVRRL